MTSEREEKKRKLQQELADIEAEEKAEKERASVLSKLPVRYRSLFSGSDEWTLDRFNAEAAYLLYAANNVLPALASRTRTSASHPSKKVAKKSTETDNSMAKCFICDDLECTCDSTPLGVSKPVNIASYTIHRDNGIRSEAR